MRGVEKCGAQIQKKGYKGKVKARGIRGRGVQPKHKFLNKYVVSSWKKKKNTEHEGIVLSRDRRKVCLERRLTRSFSVSPQECDQVHIDDVSSDDNGQDLRYRTVEFGESHGESLPFCFFAD